MSFGGWVVPSCHGCCSSYGGCWSSCHGCYSSCHGCYSSCHGCSSTIIISGHAAAPAVAAPVVASAKQATVTIQVAEGARFTVDGKDVAVAAPQQTFLTPELDPSRVYYYEMQASVKQGGKDVAASKRVAVKAGETLTVDLRDMKPWTAPKPENKEEAASVKVNLPREAQLYVDGVQLNLNGEENTFNSPPLPVGKPFHYTFKAELTRDGQKVTETRKVTVEAGKTVSLSFEKFPVVTAGR
jgi:uncharacterized protein (TIGR03000 family)